MRKSHRTENYPAVHSWNFITIEGYCMLNMEYRCCHYRYNYRLNPDRTFTRVKNDRYDPAMKPDPYPADCKRSVRSSCIGCIHFGWCDPEDGSTGETWEKNSHQKTNTRSITGQSDMPAFQQELVCQIVHFFRGIFRQRGILPCNIKIMK